MKASKSEEIQRKIAKGIYQRLDKIEVYLGVVLLIAFIADRVSDIPSGIIYNISLTSLAFCYAFSAYNKFENINKIQLFFIMIGSYALSFGSIGILFKIMHWPGANMMTTVGLLGTIISLIALVMDRVKNKDEDYGISVRWLIRLAVMSFLLLALRVVVV